MKKRIIISLVIVVALVLVSGCIEGIHKKHVCPDGSVVSDPNCCFTKDDFEFISVSYSGGGWAEACKWCKKEKQLGEQWVIPPCDTAEVITIIRVNKPEITTVDGIHIVECHYYVDEKKMTDGGLVIEKGVNTFDFLPGFNIRFDEDHIIKICCDGVCESKILKAKCE